jgi:uncharacterized membrane protein YkoI
MYPIDICKKMALVGFAIIALSLSSVAYAEKGDSSGSGGSSSGSGGSGGSGSSGSSDSSDHDDDGGDDDDDSDGGGSSDNSGSGSGSGYQGSNASSGNSNSSKSGKVASQDEVLSAVRAGKAVSLPLLLAFMATKFPGEIVDVKLKSKEGLYSYEVAYLANSSKLRVVKLNAKTLGKL